MVHNYKRRITHKIQRGAAWGMRSSQPSEADESRHEGLGPDINIGVLLSIKSLTSDNSAYKGAPYVVIIPEKFNNGIKGYAYGVSAADAVKAAQTKRFTTRGFEGADTYTGVALSAKRLSSPNPVKRQNPYVVDLGGDRDPLVGSSPAGVTSTSFTQRFLMTVSKKS